jgi:hypothetical protein
MMQNLFRGMVIIAFAAVLAVPAQAQLTAYSQDFEGLDQANPAALADDGWLVFGNVFEVGTGNYLYGYGPFPAPNGGPAFSAVDAGQGGAEQGAQQLVVYSDYNNGDHGAGHSIEANVFQEQIVDAANVGETWVFSFDAKRGNINDPGFPGCPCSTTALAFIKTLDPGAGFALTNFITFDTTALPDAWGSYELSIDIDSSLPGQILQFGFLSTATLFEPSGVLYDNIGFSSFAVPQLTPFSEDFEGLDPADPDALANAGWLVFGNVFNGATGDYLYGYGPFPSPNGGAAFAGIVTGEGGPDQGAQQLSVYSDYNNGDHGNGHLIEANVFQEQIVDAANVGQTWVFSFDAKRGNINDPAFPGCPCSTTAFAFIKTIDPAAGFALTNFITIDTTDLPDTWGSYELSIEIDASLPGQIFQFGFLTNATLFEPSGNFYDNISFAEEVPAVCDPAPATQGYWHRQCLGVPESEGGIDPGRNGRGPSAPTEPLFVEELMACADGSLEDLGFYTTFTCDGMDADPANDPCEKAEKQLTALILNVCSGRLQESCELDLSEQGCLSTGVDGLIVEVAGYIQAGSCEQASACAAAANEGEGLVGGGESELDEKSSAAAEKRKGTVKLGR